MPAPVIPAGATNFVLQETLTAYSDEAYTNAKRLSTTAIVGGNPMIDKNTETFVGQMRWFKPMNPVINVASITDASDGAYNDFSSDYSQYIKTVRTWGAKKRNLTELITKTDDLVQMGKSFGEHRALDEDSAVRSILKGVAISELLNGTATGSGQTGLGGQTFYNDPTDRRYGFYVDLGAAQMVGAPTTTSQGAQRAEAFLKAVGMAWKDYEPEYLYLVIDPAVMASLRSANLVDQDKVVDGNIEFTTIFQGKFRLLMTRTSMDLSPAEITKINVGAGVDLVGQYVSYVILPGAIAMEQLAIPNPVGVDNREASYKGTGVAEIWHRWGYVAHPAGYTWAGPEEAFPSDADYASVMDAGTLRKAVNMVDANIANVRGVWQRKTNSALQLGILPIFHA